MKKRITATMFLIAMLVGGFVFTPPKSAKAQAMPFGGFVTWSMPCTCSANFWMTLVPLLPAPGAGALVYQPGVTMTYMHHAIPIPGVWLLGDYTPGIQACYIVIPFGCMVIPSLGVIRQVGTSLPI